MLCDVSDTAIQIHGALRTSHDVPLVHWSNDARANRIIDGPDEVHRWRVGRNVVTTYENQGTTTAAAAGGDLF